MLPNRIDRILARVRLAGTTHGQSMVILMFGGIKYFFARNCVMRHFELGILFVICRDCKKMEAFSKTSKE